MTRFSLVAMFLLLFVSAIACSGGGAPSNPSLNGASDQSISDGHVAWGAFNLEIDMVGGTAKVVWNRDAQAHINVTNFIAPPNCADCVQVTGFTKDTLLKKAYVEVAFKNPTALTGYDVRAVVSNPGGGKVMINADGITEQWGSPMQYRAINVDAERTFGPLEVHGRVFEFFLPDGEKMSTIQYIVDASFPTNVIEPLIENGTSPALPNNGFATTVLTAKVWDHQGDLNAGSVMIDLSVLGGSPMSPMYDDGAHGDTAPGDGIYGTNPISTSVDPGYFMLNIFASDTAGHQSWGQGLVPVQGGGSGGNDDPEITSIETDRTTAKGPTEKVHITVNADDPDGDTMSFQFEASSGTFASQDDNEVDWKPSTSNTGKQTITVTVLDDAGGSTSQDIFLWSTSYGIIAGSTQGKIPTGTLTAVVPSDSLNMATDFEGEVLYLNFWATWCGPCVGEMPELTAMFQDYADNPEYNQVLCSTGEASSTVTNWLNGNGYDENDCSWWCIDSNSSYYSKSLSFGNEGYIPWHLIFDRDGKCRWVKVGGISSPQEITNVIDQLL